MFSASSWLFTDNTIFIIALILDQFVDLKKKHTHKEHSNELMLIMYDASLC